MCDRSCRLAARIRSFECKLCVGSGAEIAPVFRGSLSLFPRDRLVIEVRKITAMKMLLGQIKEINVGIASSGALDFCLTFRLDRDGILSGYRTICVYWKLLFLKFSGVVR